MENQALSRAEFNYLKSIDILNATCDKQNEKIENLTKENLRFQKDVNNLLTQSSTQLADINKLRRDIETKNETISNNRDELIELRMNGGRIIDMNRQLSQSNNLNESNKAIIMRQGGEIKNLENRVEELEAQLDDIEIIDGEDDDENDDDENDENDNEEYEQYEIPKHETDYVQRKKEALIQLMDGGAIDFKTIEALEQAKMNLGRELNVGGSEKLSDEQIAEKEINDALKLWDNKIPEEVLRKINHVAFFNDKNRIEAGVGLKRLVKRNFYNPTFSLID